MKSPRVTRTDRPLQRGGVFMRAEATGSLGLFGARMRGALSLVGQPLHEDEEAPRPGEGRAVPA